MAAHAGVGDAGADELEVEDDELIDEDTLEQLGAVVGGEMEIRMTILVPFTEEDGTTGFLQEAISSEEQEKKRNEENESFDSFLSSQPLNRRPKLCLL